ncbi:carph-isopro domain-containing protein [Kaistia sp. MMO-174]|uniref:carph-isopro domain-containing protein n=1 Tax=Kaistia sp. MMO-174 TaxID=3081256 RepID=UPI003019FBE2
MNTIGALIDAFGGNTKFASVIGKNASTASEMKRRESIPIDYWPAIIEAAADKGIPGVDADRLMRLHLREVA